MAFLGKIGQSLGIGDLTHQPIKSLIRTGAEIGGAVIGGPAGAAAGGALGTAAVGDQTGSHSIRADLTEGLRAGGLAYGAGALYDNAGNLLSSAEGGLDSAKSALGFPTSTAAPTATAAGSAGQIALDPSLIDNAAGGVVGSAGATGAAGGAGTAAADAAGGGGLTNVGLNSQIGAAGLGAPAASALPASTAAAAPVGTLAKINSALSSPLGRIGTTLAPVALNAVKGNQVTPQQKELQAQADRLNSQGTELTQALATGKLPAGQQATFDQAKQDAIASIKADYASRGLSGSTMEQQAIQAAETSAASAQAQQLQSLFETGMKEIGSSSDIYDKIMQANIKQDDGLSSAIAAAVGSMGANRVQQTNAT